MSTLPEFLCRKAGSGSASRSWEKSSARASHYRLYYRFYFPLLPCTLLKKWLWNRRGTSVRTLLTPGTRGSQGHRRGDTECLSLLTSVSGCHLSEAFCCFSFAHTAITKLNTIYATSLEILVFNLGKYTHELFPLPFKSRNVSNIHYKVIIPPCAY